jgi:Lon protease-like protein
MRSARIPIFPLDVVLFPGRALPLHIFEPRYVVMIGRCLTEHIEFGMVLAESTAVASTGCTTEIVRKIKDYPDGRIDILTEGRTPFRLVEVLEEKEYYEGVVEYLSEEASTRDPEIEGRLLNLFQQCRTLLSSEPWVAPDRAASEETFDESLAYSMAAGLPLGLRERQVLLEMRSEDVRRDFLIRWISDSLPALIERQRTQRQGGGNGHGPN